VKEIEKITRDLRKVIDDAEKLTQRLDNPNFVAKAPPAVVEKGRADLAELYHRRATLEERLKGEDI
jgi:valyl-tRNA synthetase